MLAGFLAPGRLYQNSAHGFGDRAEKMTAAIPVGARSLPRTPGVSPPAPPESPVLLAPETKNYWTEVRRKVAGLLYPAKATLRDSLDAAASTGPGLSFLSAVADRLGLWGQFGTAGVAWRDFKRFTAYSARLLWFLPP